MANLQRGPLHYVDSTGVLSNDSVLVSRVILTATSANAVLELADKNGNVLMILDVASSGSTEHFDFTSAPLFFSLGLKVQTLTNAKATIVYTIGRG